MEHTNIFFYTLALILVLAGVTSIIFKCLKQPIVLGYILTGVIVGSNFISESSIIDRQSITLWGDIGVIFLLFGLGLEFNTKRIKKVIKTGAITATVECILMMTIGYFMGRLIGWSNTASFFLGGMLSISSTSIVFKSIEDLKLKARHFTQIVFGVLVAEDIIAVLLIVLLTTMGNGEGFNLRELISECVKLIAFICILFTVGIYIVPYIFRLTSRFINDEILLIVCIGLCFSSVVISSLYGFSSALGAFLIGVIIAETDYQEKIVKKIKPLRHLFAGIFFISIGMLVDVSIMIAHWGTILIITFVVLTIKPITIFIGTLLSGKNLEQSLQTSMSLGQIGEFSFIIASAGLSLGILENITYPIIVAVSMLTTFCTPYSIKCSKYVYNFISKRKF